MLLNIQYIGEHLLPGTLGQSFIYLALITAFISFVFYLLGELKSNSFYTKIGRSLYGLHFLSLLVVGATLFYILFQQYYEYDYVWKHTASYLPIKYIISAFWAGQEGSFLLWIMIQAVLGGIVLLTAKRFENRVMTVIGAGQFLLTTMILGIKPLGIILGKSPFMLMREDTVNIGAEFFKNPDYLSQIFDGNGINPLLENIWMVTHPPLLFLGYAAAIVPFAYAIASLWKSDFHTWLKPAFPWMVFAIISLGGGILLGGAWAYESLTFGGFWAWDPVENASLIPLLVIIAALHMMIINKKRNHSFGLSYIFVVFGFMLVIYASYLTRSGVLGETSAHAFGNNGLSTQMIAIMTITLFVSLLLYFKNFNKFPKSKNDEFLSREFWMYVGAIILILSSFQILISTSIPVINTIFGSEIAPPQDVVAYYNRWQMPFAVLIMLLTSASLILRYGKNDIKSFIQRFGIVILATAVLFFGELFAFEIESISHMVFLFSINLAVVSSIDFLIRNKLSLHNLSNSLSHLGIGIFLMGVLVAFSTSKVISTNTSRFDLGDEVSNRENQLLIKDELKELDDYWVKYNTLRKDNNHLFYSLDFYQENKDGELYKAFSVEPSINVNRRMGNVYDPDTYHSFTKDVFTYITYADIDADLTNNHFKEIIEQEMQIGDTLNLSSRSFTLDSIRVDSNNGNMDVNNVAIIARISQIGDIDNPKTFDIAYRIKDGNVKKEEIIIESEMLRFRVVNISTKKKGIIIAVDKIDLEFLVVKSTVFPYISIMWFGVLITFIGLGFSIYRNTKLSMK